MPETTPIHNSEELSLDGLICYAAQQNASDLFLKVGVPPGLRVLGEIVKTPFPPLTPDDTLRLAYEHLNPSQRQQFEVGLEMNVSFTVPDIARIRQNIYR